MDHHRGDLAVALGVGGARQVVDPAGPRLLDLVGHRLVLVHQVGRGRRHQFERDAGVPKADHVDAGRFRRTLVGPEAKVVFGGVVVQRGHHHVRVRPQPLDHHVSASGNGGQRHRQGKVQEQRVLGQRGQGVERPRQLNVAPLDVEDVGLDELDLGLALRNQKVDRTLTLEDSRIHVYKLIKIDAYILIKKSLHDLVCTRLNLGHVPFHQENCKVDGPVEGAPGDDQVGHVPGRLVHQVHGLGMVRRVSLDEGQGRWGTFRAVALLVRCLHGHVVQPRTRRRRVSKDQQLFLDVRAVGQERRSAWRDGVGLVTRWVQVLTEESRHGVFDLLNFRIKFNF